MSNNLNSLNSDQKEAVLHTGNLMCVAGAGSGKTKTLTTKIAHLLEQGVNPNQILGLTFTNKAANEMRERITDIHSSGADVNMTTFHSFSARFIRPNAEWIGRTEDFSIYDDTDQKNLIKRIMKHDSYSTLNGSADMTPLKFLGFISKIKSATTDINIDLDKIDHEALLGREITPAEAFVFYEYQDFLLQFNSVDFNDLVSYTVAIMKIDSNTIPKYTHVLIDEFQDTDPVQFAMIIIFAKSCKLTAFSDMDQTIYEWRNAIALHVLQFIEEFKTKVIKLETNYRSTPTIVNAANQVIELNNNRIEKIMRPTRSEDHPIIVNRVMDSDHESASVADTIKNLKEDDQNCTVGILYRQNRCSRKIETSLRRMNIKYILHKGVDFIKRREIATTLRLFRFVTNPRDMESAKVVLTHLGSGFGQVAMSKVEKALSNSEPNDILLGKVNLGIKDTLQKQYEEIMMDLDILPTLPLAEIPEYLASKKLPERLCAFSGDNETQTNDRIKL